MADFKLNPQGIIEICKDEPMRAELNSIIQRICAQATSDANKHLESLQELTKTDLTKMRNQNYYSRVITLSKTCIGSVWCGNTLGILSEAAYKSMSRQVL